MDDFETHPRGTGEVLRQLREEREALEVRVAELEAASKLLCIEIAGYVNRIEWRSRESERVVKVTRHPQPQYGYTNPVLATP